ncbi:hypothetical protein [Halorubellus sp. PRR65]|uniref:hypothetical protein n=1 Tax=Halorubellus sp. PRR65 TaxID=3098148 RepID=UPI002B258670|nr:hypothetical protein [Halorubellus sp. PRR65]
MNREIQLLTVLVVVASLIVGASAFTTGSVERSSSVDVVADNSGLIGLEDGTSGDLVYTNSTNALEIDFSQGGGSGVNTAAHFELGNPTDATNQSAFNITNNDASEHDITVEYTGVTESSDTDANIQFQIYDSSGSSVGTLSEESTSATITNAAAGSTYHVVVVVDTYGLDTNADLSGTLNVSV